MTVAFWTVLYGTYFNWFITVLAASFGTAALSPITGVGHTGQPWQELLVTIGFMSVGIAIIVASTLCFGDFANKPDMIRDRSHLAGSSQPGGPFKPSVGLSGEEKIVIPTEVEGPAFPL